MKFLAILLISIGIDLHSFGQIPDTLTTKRVFITTKLYRNGFKLSNTRVSDLYKDNRQSRVKYKWGFYMNPVAPVITITGVGIAAIALKGQDATSIDIRGQEAKYKIRSLPKLLVGLGLAAAGLCMIESSNELIKHSAEIYNAKLKNQKPLAHFIQKVDFGLTDSNNLGITLRF
jgi:hypothetical protein